MLRNLLIISCLFYTTGIFAQNTAPGAIPPSPKDTPAENEFQSMGSALPKVLVVTMPTFQTIPAKQAGKTDSTKKPTTIEIPAKHITNKDVQYDANLFLMIFNPMCGHCEDMTELMEKNISLFNKTKVLMVGAASMRPYMDIFRNGLQTDKYPTFIFGTDSSRLVDELFLYKDLPQINVYDKDRKLIKTFNGDLTIDSLKPYIQ